MTNTSLATRATNAELALRAILRGEEFSSWIRGALEEGEALCTELLQGATAKPGVVSYFNYPETRKGLKVLQETLPTQREQEEELGRMLEVLTALREEKKSTPEDEETLSKVANFLHQLSRSVIHEDELVRRINVAAAGR